MAQQQIAASNFDITLPARITALLSLAILAVLLAFAPIAQAQTFTLLHTFTGSGGDGGSPSAGLTKGPGESFYGVASENSSLGGAFKLTQHEPNWLLSLLHHLPVVDSKLVIGPDGNLYGTTSEGGQGDCEEGGGCGTIFMLQPPPTSCAFFPCPWRETVLYRFTGGSDGGTPISEVVFDAAGNLYGVTLYGGSSNCNQGCGVAYKLTRSGNGWTESVIYSFQGSSDGYWPSGGLVFDPAGNLYGVTQRGGPGLGVLYELVPSNGGWTKTILHNFQAQDGDFPSGTLAMDPAGNLYGAGGTGGAFNDGVVYELSQPGNWSYAVLYSFTASDLPVGGLTLDSAGSLYGDTLQGGTYGYGFVYKLMPSGGNWVLSHLHDFNVTDGLNANGLLTLDANGNVYGTSSSGGGFFQICEFGCGTAWEITQ